MVFALIGVVFAIRALNTSKVEGFFHAIGVEPGVPQSPGLQPGSRPLSEGEERYNICRTRIHSVEWKDRKVEEFREGLNMRWMAVDPTPREISYMEVEKWLSRNCQIIIQPFQAASSDRSLFNDFVTVQYIDGQKLIIKRGPGPVYQIESKTFHSPYLDNALKDLEKIAQF